MVVEVDLANPPGHVLEEVGIDVEGADPDPARRERTDPEFSLVTANGATSLGSTFLRAEPDRDAMAPRLVKHGATYVAAIAKAVVGASRSCARPLSVDGRPLIGRVPGTDGLWIAAGHGPWGGGLDGAGDSGRPSSRTSCSDGWPNRRLPSTPPALAPRRGSG